MLSTEPTSICSTPTARRQASSHGDRPIGRQVPSTLPAALAALTVLLVCVPIGNRDVSASVHVTPADIGSAALVTFAIVGMGVRAMRRHPVKGSEGMIGLVGIAKTALMPRGQVAVRGELWEAISDDPIEAGVAVKVTAIEGLKLHVISIQEKGVPQ